MSSNAPTRQLTLFDSICIIAGIVIGAGIYETTPNIAANAATPTGLLLVWVVGGAISLIGALCYAELATAYPKDGGDFIYLSRAYGPRAGFLFAWTEYWMVRPGTVGMMAFVFARFANELFPLRKLLSRSFENPEGASFVAYAIVAIVLLTLTNALGVRSGKWTQNALTVAKFLGLLAVFFVGMLFVPAAAPQQLTAATPASSNYQLALILVLFAYGGWNDLAYVAAEVRDPNRNLFRALALGVVAVTTIYILVNIAFLKGLGLPFLSDLAKGETAGRTVATELLHRSPAGSYGGKAISLLICFSCLGAINGTLLAGSRIYYAAGTEHQLVSWLGSWSGKFDAPVRALLLQGAMAMFWTILFGNEQGFVRLLIFTAPVFWFFAFMVAISVMILREKDRKTPRQHEVILYPWLPILFSLACAFMLVSSVTYALSQWHQEDGSWALEPKAALGVIAAGIVVAVLGVRETAR